MSRIRSLVAVFVSLVAALTLFGCGASSGASSSSSASTGKGSASPVEFKYSGNVKHSDVALGERSRDSFDQATYEVDLNEFELLIGSNAADADKLNQAYDRLERHMANLVSDVALLKFDWSLNVADSNAANRYGAKLDLYNKEFARCTDLFARALDSKQGDGFRVHIGEAFASQLDGSHGGTAESPALRQKSNELAIRYEQMVASGAKQLDLESLYVDLVNTNNALARSCGYDNYAELAYEQRCGRDFSVSDIEVIRKVVVSDFVPIYMSYMADSVDMDLVDKAFDQNDDPADVKLENLGKCLATVSPAFGESFEYLQRNGLFDIGMSGRKTVSSSGFVLECPSYNDGILFVSPYGETTDYLSVVHEFGHFNHMYRVQANAFLPNSLPDVQESMSQSLELLCCDSYDRLCPGYGKALAKYAVLDKMFMVRDSFAIDEAEYRAYTTSDLTVGKLHSIWDDVAKKYQMPDDSDSFTTVSQVYTNPFYYVGYGTSALVAFDLYVESLTDYNAAVTKYLKMSEVPPETTFRKMLEIAGIDDVLDAKAVSGLCKKLDKALCG